MDHEQIEQFNIVDRYVMSRLVEEESVQFEEHFIDCPQCIDRLKTARGLTQGLRRFTVEQAARQESATARESRGASLGSLTRRSWGLAACVALLAIVFISIALIQIRDLRQDVARSDTAISELQRLQDESQKSASASAQDHQEVEQDLRDRVRQLETDLQTAQKGRADQAVASHGWMQPVTNLPIFVLNAIRGPEVTEINLSRVAMDFVIALPLEEKAKHRTYRVTVLKEQRVLWESPNLKPDADNALVIGFNSSFFQPGKYVLKVEGVPTSSGSGSTTANYPFRVNKHP